MVYTTRLIDDLITKTMSGLPGIILMGPRGTGKTTTASRHANTVIRLDQAGEAVAFLGDPDAALRGLTEPVLLDEWQLVPGVLSAVKRSVDAHSSPGRFIVTGSVRTVLRGQMWPATGRLIDLTMWGLTVRERLGRTGGAAFLDRAAAGADLPAASDSPDLRGYVDLIALSGFPEASLGMGEGDRERWLQSYLTQLLTRDTDQLDEARDPHLLRRYFEANVLNTAGVVQYKTLYDSARINRRTAQAYDRLLVNLLVVEELPAWTSNRLKRLALTPKRYVIDPALAMTALKMDAGAVMRNGDLLGRLLDSFVVAQLRAELEVSNSKPRLYHLRAQDGRAEVDVLAELGGGGRGVVAMEIKAGAAPTLKDARHLVTLRDQLGDQFVRGVVFHTGPRTFDMSERIVAAPISALWAG